MTTTIWVRYNPNQPWRTAMTDMPKETAHQVADRFNKKYDKEYWVSETKPDQDVKLE